MPNPEPKPHLLCRPKKRCPTSPSKSRSPGKTLFSLTLHCMHIEKPTPRASLPAHRKTISTHPLPPLPQKTMSAEKRERYPTHTQNIPIPLPPDGLYTEKKRSPRTPYRPDLKKSMSAEKRERCPHTRKTSLSHCHPTVSTPKNDLYTPGSSTRISPLLQNSPLKSKKYAPPQMRQGRNLSIGSLCSRFR